MTGFVEQSLKSHSCGIGLDSVDFPALTAYIAAASVSASGGKGELDKTKTVGKGRMVEADRSGGRDGLIGDKGGSFEGCVDAVV